MELLYVWVESYGNIKKQGFNFSREYDIEYNHDSNKLKIEKRENPVPKGFFGKNISNVTAIVGKNGSGKSTLLEFLNHLENSDNLDFIHQVQNFKYICIYKTKEGLFYEHWLDKQPIVKDEIKENIYENTEYGKKYQRVQNKEVYLEKFYNSDIMTFYSNNQITPWYDGVADYVNKPNKNSQEFYYTRTLNQLKFLWDKNNNRFLEANTNEDIKKLGDVNNVILNVNKLYNYVEKWRKLKENLKIDEVTNDEEKNIDNLDKIYRDLDKMLREEYELNRGRTRAIITEESIKSKIFDYIFCNLLDLIKYNNVFNGKLIINSSPIKEKITFGEKLNEVIRQIEEWDKNKNYEEKYIVFQPLLNLDIKNGKDTIRYDDVEYKVKIIFGTEIVLDINLIKKMYEDKSKYLNNIIELFNLSYFPLLSTGGEILLDILATFYNNRTILPSEQKINNILIAIDEGDVHFHPEWQRRYFDIIVKFISEIYKDKNIQIILTSHSPFVASDLPRENVIMLDTDKDGNCIVRNDKKDKEIKTFGANIFDLYTDAFFVESSFGEFAKVKIKDVVKDLTPNDEGKYSDLTKERIKEIEYIIDSIGEKLVSAKLEKLYEEYRNNKNSVEYKKEQLKMLQEKLGLSNEQMINIIKTGDLND